MGTIFHHSDQLSPNLVHVQVQFFLLKITFEHLSRLFMFILTDWRSSNSSFHNLMRLISEFNNGCENTSASEKVGWCGRALRLKKSKSVNYKNKGSPGHFTVEINVGKRRIRHTTTLALNHQFLDRLKIDRKSKFRLVFMSDPSPSDVSFKNKMTTFTL